MRNYRTSGRQFSWLIVSFIMTPAIINMPQHLARIASMDAWITQLLPLIYGFVVCFVFYRLAQAYPGKNFFQISREVAGKWVGGLLNAVFLLHLWFTLARDTTLFIGFIKTNLLLKTPYEVSLLLLMIVLIYYGKSSIEVTARVNDMFFLLLACMVVTLPLLLSNDISVFQMEPMMIEPPADVGIASALSASYYGDVTAFAAFLPALNNPKLLYASFRHGIAITALLITLVVVTGICVLGPTIMSREIYPTYTMVQQIHITDFLDRVEIFIFSVYFPSFIVSITVAFFAFLIGITSFTKSDNYQFYSKPTGFLILMTLVFAFGGTPEVTMFANYGLPVYLFATQPIALAVTLMLALRKSRRNRDTGAGSRPEDNPNADAGIKAAGKKLRTWKKVTHLVIASGVACVIIGLLVAKDYQWVGRICAIGYAISMLALVISTYMEQKRATQL